MMGNGRPLHYGLLVFTFLVLLCTGCLNHDENRDISQLERQVSELRARVAQQQASLDEMGLILGAAWEFPAVEEELIAAVRSGTCVLDGTALIILARRRDTEVVSIAVDKWKALAGSALDDRGSMYLDIIWDHCPGARPSLDDLAKTGGLDYQHQQALKEFLVLHRNLHPTTTRNSGSH